MLYFLLGYAFGAATFSGFVYFGYLYGRAAHPPRDGIPEMAAPILGAFKRQGKRKPKVITEEELYKRELREFAPPADPT